MHTWDEEGSSLMSKTYVNPKSVIVLTSILIQFDSGCQTPKDWENALAGSMQNRLRSSFSSGAKEKWKGWESWGVRTCALCMFIFLVKIKILHFEQKPVFCTSLVGPWSKQHLMVKKAPSRVEGIYCFLFAYVLAYTHLYLSFNINIKV